MPTDTRTLTSLDALVAALPAADRDAQACAGAMAALRLDLAAIRKYCHYAPDRYTRNLVKRTPVYELLVLCWNPGQVSPIHNHASQDCWMHVVAGDVEEIQYQAHPRADGTVSLAQLKSTNVAPTNTAYINDTLALHRICNRGLTPAVTIHLYSLPIDTCKIYEEATGQVKERPLPYYSADGVIQ